MNMELSFSVLSDKEVQSNMNLNEFALHSQSKTKYIVQEEEIQPSKTDESPAYSAVDMPIYESVQAVLKRDVYELLKFEVDNKLLLSMKNCAEPFEISELENGHLTFTGTLKAILLCQQILFSFLKNSKLYPSSIFNEVEKEEDHICQISLPRNVDSEAKNKAFAPKISSIITIPQKSKSQSIVKSEVLPNDFRLERDSKHSKHNVIESGYGGENETSGGQQKFSRLSEIQKKQPLLHARSTLKVLRRPKALKYECGMCDGIFESTPTLQQQACNDECLEESQNRLPVSKKFTCEVCSFKARHRREYKLHLENAHPITYSCPQCSYRTTKKVHYIRHVRNVHENQRPYCCHLCGVAFKRCDALKQHQVVHFKYSSSSLADPSTNAPFKCKVCQKVVRSAAYLREHMLTHSEERSFLCEVCGASFKTRAVHRNHLKVVHSQGVRAICRSCGKTFSTKYSLKRHTRQHETKGRKQASKIRLWKKQPSSETGWVPLLLGSDLLTSGPSVPIAVAEKEEIVSLSKSDCITSAGSNSRNDKIISSLYAESTNSENFGITIDSQIPYVIHSTQEITSD